MSGGSYSYMCFTIMDTYGGCMKDPVMESLLKDLCEVLHDLEWADSADISQDDYLRSVERFKAKWIGNPAPILRDVVEQEIQHMRKRLLTAVAWTDGGDRDS